MPKSEVPASALGVCSFGPSRCGVNARAIRACNSLVCSILNAGWSPRSIASVSSHCIRMRAQMSCDIDVHARRLYCRL
eukprot:scaffold10972_cov127-Isochrysis_galbana.AAC.12